MPGEIMSWYDDGGIWGAEGWFIALNVLEILRGGNAGANPVVVVVWF